MSTDAESGLPQQRPHGEKPCVPTNLSPPITSDRKRLAQLHGLLLPRRC